MRVWIVCFIVLFGSAELLEWLQTFSLPMPIFVLGGAFLAIASNYNKLTHLPFHPDYEAPELSAPDRSTTDRARLTITTHQSTTDASPVVPVPGQVPPARAATISFEISKTFQPRD